MIAGAAAFPRFVVHDLRLSARGLASMFGALTPAGLAILIALLFVALHAAAWPVAGWLIAIEDGPDGLARMTAILASGVALTLPWIVGQSTTEFTRTLFARSDLELILSSPVDAHSLLAARALSIAIGAVASVGLLLTPLADVAALRGHPHWLALYPALLAAGLAGTGLAVVLAMGLFLTVGPRRARLLSQIAATVVGASAVLGAQVVAMLPERVRASVLAAFAPPAEGENSVQSLLMTPVRAAAGDSRALLIWTAFGASVFVLACLLFGERFARAAVASSGAPANAGSSARRASRFGASVGAALRVKERRVVWRDPWLMSQLLLQAAYTTPLAVILWRGGGPTGTVGVAFTPALVVIAAQLAGALSWIALSAEDAPDFLTTAPVSRPDNRARQDRRDRAADRPHPRASPRRIGLRFALGGILRSSVRRRSGRLGRAGQSLAPGAVSSRPRAPPPCPVETCRHDGAPGLDPVGYCDGRGSDRLMGDGCSSRRGGRRPGAQLEMGGCGGARVRRRRPIEGRRGRIPALSACQKRRSCAIKFPRFGRRRKDRGMGQEGRSRAPHTTQDASRDGGKFFLVFSAVTH